MYKVVDGVYCYPDPIGHWKYARVDKHARAWISYPLESGEFTILVYEIGPSGCKISNSRPPTHAFACWLDNFRRMRGKEPSEIQIERALWRFAYNTPLPLRERLKIFRRYKVWYDLNH